MGVIDAIVEVVYGSCERNLFTEPGPGHRTYRDEVTGDMFTGVDSYDSECTLIDNVEQLLAYRGYRFAGTVWADHLNREVDVYLAVDGSLRDATVYLADTFAPEQYPIYDAWTERILLTGEDGDDGW